MKTINKSILSIVLVACFFVDGFSRNREIDSLLVVYHNGAIADTIRLQAIDYAVNDWLNHNMDSSIYYANVELDFARKVNDGKYEGLALNSIGRAYYQLSDFSKSLEYQLAALKIFDSSGDKWNMASCYICIGLIYRCQSDSSKALQYQLMALKICEQIGDSSNMAACYNNIGIIYSNKSNHLLAIKYYYKSLVIARNLRYTISMFRCYSNIADSYRQLGNYTLALENQLISLSIVRPINYELGISICYINLCELYISMGKYPLAITYGDSAMKLVVQIGQVNFQRVLLQDLSSAYVKMGNYKLAYSNYVLFKKLTDSIFNVDNNVRIEGLKTKYEVGKKDIEIHNQKIISDAQKSRQLIVIFCVVVVLVLVVIFSLFLFGRFRVSQSQKAIIQSKQTEILDSIHYAKRIQDALLKEQNHVSLHLPDHFVLFKPKDIVSGDFYWSLEKQGYWYVAVADCTGHGVPGAFLTMLGTSFLNEINATDRLLSPAAILDLLRDRMIKELGQTGVVGENKDGMDISLLRIDLSTKEVMWAGANNSLYVISGGVLSETKANKQPIGYADNLLPFTNHSFSLSCSDQLVIFSDGYADQFGGDLGKKFMSKRFKDLFVTNFVSDMVSQKNILNNVFEDWKGSTSQIDDVCVIGIKL